MNIVLASLPPTDEPKAPLPPADLYVVDLAGRGMVRWIEATRVDCLIRCAMRQPC